MKTNLKKEVSSKEYKQICNFCFRNNIKVSDYVNDLEKYRPIFLAKKNNPSGLNPNSITYEFEKRLKNKYNMSIIDYNNLLEEQGGVCAICGQKETSLTPNRKNTMPLSVDHDHKTGKIRGLLCSYCNHGLGHFQDNVNYLKNAQNYLIKFGSKDF